MSSSSHNNHEHNHNHHGHGHGGHNHNQNQNYNFKFGFGILLNALFIAIELGLGHFANSAALIADAIHNFSDVIGLVISWAGVWISGMSKKTGFTFSFKKATIVAAFLNAILLIVGTVYILIESVGHLLQEFTVNSFIIIIVAFVGIIINGFTAMLFMKNSKDDINIRSAFIHMASDALISLGVVISGIIIYYTGFVKIDGIVGIIIAIIIFFGTYGLLKESSKLILLGVPSGVNFKKIEEVILNAEGVKSLHDLHIWGISTTENSLSVHVVVNETFSLKALQVKLLENFKIKHVTMQTESEDGCEVKC
jgi:cobalt-zinc-cadmium efflux system protein